MVLSSFAPTYGSTERDVRFVFCACVISYILDDWSGVDVDRAVDFIRQCQVSDHLSCNRIYARLTARFFKSYELAVGQTPGEEAHGNCFIKNSSQYIKRLIQC
jgi:geranylgeranyl transferase type-1 subunit beta